MGGGWNERTWLAWLSRVRVLVITLLLGIELAIIEFTLTNVPVRLFLSVVLLWYTIAVFFLVLHRVWDDHGLQARLQVLTDLVFATAILYVTGGIDTSFNFLYPLLIIVASILLPRYWTFYVAGLAFIGFGAILELSYFGVIRSYSVSTTELTTLQAVIFINLVAYLAIAYLGSKLAARLRQVREQYERQREVLESLTLLHETIVTSIRSGLITTDLDGHITLMNPAAERVIECSRTDWIGRKLTDLLQCELPQPGSEGEIWCVTASGRPKTFGTTVSVLVAPDSSTVGYVYALNDTTEIRRLERQLRIQDRMAVIGRMAAGIAHEIRNPLTSIAGSALMLRDGAQLSEEEQQLMEIVIHESERLNNIISDFLAFAREKEFHFDRIDLIPCLEDTLTLLQQRPEFQENGMRVVTSWEVNEAWAVADEERMKQVFWNICQNAIRAMCNQSAKDGGTAAGELRVALRAVEKNWVISFADTGPGLPPSVQDRIFEPFQSGFSGGTGLGLAIVYQIMQAHEGSISVHSEPGKGAEFRLQLKQAGAATVAAGR